MAVVACMDARLDILGVLELDTGEAHIIRNAGGVITDDVIRSLSLSQHKLGTTEIVLVHHTNCGLQEVTDDGFKNELKAAVGVRPDWAVEAFVDPYIDVRESIEKLLANPFIVSKERISGFVYDVNTGGLHKVR